MLRIEFLTLATLLLTSSFGVCLSPVIAQESNGSPDRIDLSGAELDFARKELVHRQTQPLSCGFRTLKNRFHFADLALVVKRSNSFLPDDKQKTEVAVRLVLKRSKSISLQVGDFLTLPVAMSNQEHGWALVFCVIDGPQGVGVTEIRPISKASADYFSELWRKPVGSERVHFLIKAEETGNASVSSNAFGELQAMPDSKIKRSVEPLTRKLVLQRLQSSKLTSAPRNFYLKLLGFAGKSSDSQLLEQYVFPPDKQPVTFLQSAAEAYLRLGGEAARRRFVEYYFTTPATVGGAQQKIQLPQLFAAYNAVRRLRQEPEMRSTVNQADRFVFENTIFGDLVLGDAMKERDDSFIGTAIDSYQRQDVAPVIRIAILAYLAMMAEESKSAEEVQRLRNLLNSARQDEPKLYEQAMNYFTAHK